MKIIFFPDEQPKRKEERFFNELYKIDEISALKNLNISMNNQLDFLFTYFGFKKTPNHISDLREEISFRIWNINHDLFPTTDKF